MENVEVKQEPGEKGILAKNDSKDNFDERNAKLIQQFLQVDVQAHKYTSGSENETDLSKIECNVSEYKNYNPPMKESIDYYEKEMVLTVMQNLESCCTDDGDMEYSGDLIEHTSKFCNVCRSEVEKVKTEFETFGKLIEPVRIETESKSKRNRRKRLLKKLLAQNGGVIITPLGNKKEPVKRASRPLTKGEKEIILYVYKQTAEHFLSYPIKKDIFGAASALTSVSTKTILNIMNEVRDGGGVREPIYACNRRPRPNQEDRMTEAQLTHIKERALIYCVQQKTMDDLLKYVNENTSLPHFKKTTLYTLLRNNGITFPRKSNKRHLPKKTSSKKKKPIYSSSSSTDVSTTSDSE